MSASDSRFVAIWASHEARARIYSEPNEREIRGFAMEFAAFYARSDSYSVLNDLVWCANRMAPEVRERFKRSVRGAPDTPGIIKVIEKLQRRTQIDPATLDIQVDKRPYPEEGEGQKRPASRRRLRTRRDLRAGGPGAGLARREARRPPGLEHPCEGRSAANSVE